MSTFTKKHKYGLSIVVAIIITLSVNTVLVSASQNIIYLEATTDPNETEGTISLAVFVNTESPIKVVGGTIVFDTEALEVIDTEINRSLVKLWAVKPSYNKGSNTIDFGGGILNEGGFVGEGEIFTILFKRKLATETSVSFKGAILLAHDGKGSDVLSETKNVLLK